MQTPLVKVLIASFNRREWLVGSIESALRQSYPNFHVLLFDDASTDGSADVCRDYSARFPDKVTAVLRSTNAGLRQSFNEALSGLASGEYLAVHAHDDLCSPDRFATSVRALNDHPCAAMVFSDADLIDDEGRLLNTRFSQLWGAHEQERDFVRRVFLNGNFVCATTVMIRGDAVRKLRLRLPRRVQLCTDYYLWLALGSVGEVVFMEEPVGVYRLSQGQMTERFRETQREDFLIPPLAWRRFQGLRQRISRGEMRAATLRKGWGYIEARKEQGDLRDVLWFGLRLLRLAPTAAALERLAAASVTALRVASGRVEKRS